MAHLAALITLDAKALFSPIRLHTLMDPSVGGTKSAVERHHLFPRANLQSQGINELRKINQIANFALVEWPENLRIGAKAPSEYVPALDAKLTLRMLEGSTPEVSASRCLVSLMSGARPLESCLPHLLPGLLLGGRLSPPSVAVAMGPSDVRGRERTGGL